MTVLLVVAYLVVAGFTLGAYNYAYSRDGLIFVRVFPCWMLLVLLTAATSRVRRWARDYPPKGPPDPISLRGGRDER